jgi:phospholipid/cholesterol/gamma-HCH transport system ATP-binding protein
VNIFSIGGTAENYAGPQKAMNTIDQIPMPAEAKRTEAEEQGSAPVIAVEGLCKSFGNQRVLNGISLSVKRGETLAVLGRSGTGKSVLLRIIVGLEKPDSGSVLIHGQDITGLALDQMGEVRKKMGFLFQHAALYDSLTVEQNVAFPLQHHKREMSKSERSGRVRELLAEVGMEEARAKMPSDISGGMQKRVGLARALALEPDILLLDEPTAGLDPISSGEIDDLVLKLQQEHHIASIVVTHDLHSAKTIAGRLALLNEGDVVIQGNFEELQNSDIEFVREFLKHS